jgi:hypothetical protein
MQFGIQIVDNKHDKDTSYLDFLGSQNNYYKTKSATCLFNDKKISHPISNQSCFSSYLLNKNRLKQAIFICT